MARFLRDRLLGCVCWGGAGGLWVGFIAWDKSAAKELSPRMDLFSSMASGMNFVVYVSDLCCVSTPFSRFASSLVVMIFDKPLPCTLMREKC